MKLLQGRGLARKKLAVIQADVAKLTKVPCLVDIVVGLDASSHAYADLKGKEAQHLGIRFRKIALPKNTSQEEMATLINDLNEDPEVHGILMQLPLPEHLDARRVISFIAPEKDVDGLLPDSPVQSPTVQAIVTLIKQAFALPEGKTASLLVNSDAFYNGIREALHREGIRIVEDSQDADIVVVAKGKPGFLTQSMIKDGATVIDVGITMQQGKTAGDSAPDVGRKAGFITPVPGGVGPLTVAYLFENLLSLYEKYKGDKENSGK